MKRLLDVLNREKGEIATLAWVVGAAAVVVAVVVAIKAIFPGAAQTIFQGVTNLVNTTFGL